MTTAPSISLVSGLAHPRGKSGVPTMSWTNLLDTRELRASFARRWAAFLHENYANPEEVSVVYGVRFQTARNWWGGINRPSGDVVAHAFVRHGDDLRRHLERAS